MINERGLALCDIDNTFVKGYIVFPLVEREREQGLIKPDAVDAINDSLARYRNKDLSYEQFARLLLVHWSAGLKGSSFEDALESAREFVRSTQVEFFPYVRPMLENLHRTHDTYLVTGETDFVGQSVAELLGTTGHIASIFETENGIFTGGLVRALAEREEKDKAVKPLWTRYSKNRSVAFGDSDGDTDILEAVEHPVCVKPSASLRAYAEPRGWNIADIHEVESVVASLGF